jgi:hypothetical protein
MVQAACSVETLWASSPLSLAFGADAIKSCFTEYLPGMIRSAAAPLREVALSNETGNVAILTEAYRLWHETKASNESVDHWLSIVADDIHEFVAQGDAVVMRGTMAWTNNATGKSFHSPKLDFWRFRNGKAIEFYEFFDTAAAIAPWRRRLSQDGSI